jgi:hypothetical protein
MAEDYLGELYVLQVTFDSINKRYFYGQSGLFTGGSHALSQMVEQAEKLVDLYNGNLAAGLELLDSAVDGPDVQESEYHQTINLSVLRRRTEGAASSQAAYLVDMAKAEALDSMGEMGAAAALVDRHI